MSNALVAGRYLPGSPRWPQQAPSKMSWPKRRGRTARCGSLSLPTWRDLDVMTALWPRGAGAPRPAFIIETRTGDSGNSAPRPSHAPRRMVHDRTIGMPTCDQSDGVFPRAL